MEPPTKRKRGRSWRRLRRERTTKAKASIAKDLFDDDHYSTHKSQQDVFRFGDSYRPDYSSHDLFEPSTPSRGITHNNRPTSPKSDNRFTSRTIRPNLKSQTKYFNDSPLKNKTTALQTLLELHKQCQQEEAQIRAGIQAMRREKKEAEKIKPRNSYRGTINPSHSSGSGIPSNSMFRFNPSVPDFVPKARVDHELEGPRIKEELTDYLDFGLPKLAATQYPNLLKGLEKSNVGVGIKSQENRKRVRSSDLSGDPFISRPRIEESDWVDLFEKPQTSLKGIENRRKGNDCPSKVQDKSSSYFGLERRMEHMSFGSHL